MTNVSYKKMFDLTSKTAVVTGGVGILGRCFCAGLAEFGANVVVIDIDGPAVVKFSDELSTKYGVKCLDYFNGMFAFAKNKCSIECCDFGKGTGYSCSGGCV